MRPDETSAAKGQDYITVFMDLLLRRVLFAIEGRDASTVKAFAADLVAHGGDPELITRTSSDMSNAFIAGVGDNLPNAEMTFDHFHVMKLPSEAVDDVRRPVFVGLGTAASESGDAWPSVSMPQPASTGSAAALAW